MLVFIDDSGDPGFEFSRGSSHFFVIILLIFNDELEAEKAAVAIKELRRKLQLPDTFEFKFNKSRMEIREAFLELIQAFDIRIRAIIVDKKKIYSGKLRKDKSSFYSYFIKICLQNTSSILNAKIKIDGSGDRTFRRSFLAYLRQQLNSEEHRIIKSVKLVDSKKNILIQAADMIAGAVHRSYLEKNDANIYKGIIQHRIEDEWKFT